MGAQDRQQCRLAGAGRADQHRQARFGQFLESGRLFLPRAFLELVSVLRAFSGEMLVKERSPVGLNRQALALEALVDRIADHIGGIDKPLQLQRGSAVGKRRFGDGARKDILGDIEKIAVDFAGRLQVRSTNLRAQLGSAPGACCRWLRRLQERSPPTRGHGARRSPHRERSASVAGASCELISSGNTPRSTVQTLIGSAERRVPSKSR